MCCANAADPGQTHYTEREETVEIPQCSFTHLAGQVQQCGCISEEGTCSQQTAVKPNQAYYKAIALLFCEQLKTREVYQGLSERARFLP